MKEWFVYMLRCADGTLYTGVTTDIARRIEEHNLSPKAAKYTRVRRPVSLAYQEAQPSRNAACARESAIKKLSREEKLALLAERFPQERLHEAGYNDPVIQIT